MDASNIDVSITNFYKIWQIFKKGKRKTSEFREFEYCLEENMFGLSADLLNKKYKHGGYREFEVYENKRRMIRVATMRDRLVHRLVYEYLYSVFDKLFLFEVWSSRKNKGLLGAIERTQDFFDKHNNYCFWRGDISKFFDSVSQELLLMFLNRRLKDNSAMYICRKIIGSFKNKKGEEIGMPIGNITSQIFANIYLNELDLFIKKELKPAFYIRYGDDFLIVDKNIELVSKNREHIIAFIKNNLLLQLNPKNDIVRRCKEGVKYLGVKIYPNGRNLLARNYRKIENNLNHQNMASYRSLILKHSLKNIKKFDWLILEKIENGEISL
jgi:RNA-directed DNA polymerase